MKSTKILSLLLILVTVIGLLSGCFAEMLAGNDTTFAFDDVSPETKGDFIPEIDDTVYNFGTVHGVTWQWGGKADPTNEDAVRREEELNSMYHLDTGNTRECVKFIYSYDTVGKLHRQEKLPTVFRVSSTDLPRLMNAGWSRDITACVEHLGISPEDFNQAFMDYCKDKEGNIYGLPYPEAYSMCLVVNGALYKEAGIVDANGEPIPPKTWDELIEQSETIFYETGISGLAVPAADLQGGWFFTNIAWNYGADLCVWNEDTVKFESNIDTPETIAALEWYKTACQSVSLAGSPAALNRKDIINMLKDGVCAIILEATDVAPQITDITNGGMKASDIYYFNMPAGPGGHQYNEAGGSFYWFSSTATDEQVVAALEYLMYTGNFSQEWDEESKNASVKTWSDKKVREIVQLPAVPVYHAPWQDEYIDMLLNTAGGKGELYNFDTQFKPVYDYIQQPGSIHLDEEFATHNLYTELAEILKVISTDPFCDTAELAAQADANYARQLDELQ